MPGRRPASYWFMTERTGSVQISLLNEEEWDDLPLVNALREGVLGLASLTVLRAR